MIRLVLIALTFLVPWQWAQADVYQDAVAHKDRSAKDRERDAREFPADLLKFAGLKPGMKVADIFGGAGYYSELASYVVGPQGEVRLVNNAPYNEFAKEGLKERFTEGRLPNVKRSTVESCNLRLGTGELDAAMIVLSYHDLYYQDEGWPTIDAGDFLDQINRALKPGGVFLVIDHAAKDGTGSSAAQDLHRIDEVFARKDISAHGFKYEGSFDKLRNPDDDRGVLVFNPAVRGKTDRFVHLYRKTR
ncbi:MAG: class I SAM-dependent methyltransferase [Gammaproteobacteria bacterium]|nr:class I SAM-dependent methyltransferase [Gammaproteobacteria bacterium]